jgi:hypothetical protein
MKLLEIADEHSMRGEREPRIAGSRKRGNFSREARDDRFMMLHSMSQKLLLQYQMKIPRP